MKVFKMIKNFKKTEKFCIFCKFCNSILQFGIMYFTIIKETHLPFKNSSAFDLHHRVSMSIIKQWTVHISQVYNVHYQQCKRDNAPLNVSV